MKDRSCGRGERKGASVDRVDIDGINGLLNENRTMSTMPFLCTLLDFAILAAAAALF